jgi:hypothetical protein
MPMYKGKRTGNCPRLEILADHRQHLEVEEHQQQVGQRHAVRFHHDHRLLVHRDGGCEGDHQQAGILDEVEAAAEELAQAIEGVGLDVHA